MNKMRKIKLWLFLSKLANFRNTPAKKFLYNISLRPPEANRKLTIIKKSWKWILLIKQRNWNSIVILVTKEKLKGPNNECALDFFEFIFLASTLREKKKRLTIELLLFFHYLKCSHIIMCGEWWWWLKNKFSLINCIIVVDNNPYIIKIIIEIEIQRP